MQKQGVDALKRFAQMAKNRLRNKVREQDIKASKGKSNFKVIYGAGVDVKSKIITKEDEKLYVKIRDMLDENVDIINPIARLIDYKVYNKMDTLSKERYLFEMVNKYKMYKTKYQQEKIKQAL
ncbi:MAG: hypothetical protein E7378_00610 [Clostridiales bacterium]|nr:hypothetical protein [Clostridiales bacterium]